MTFLFLGLMLIILGLLLRYLKAGEARTSPDSIYKKKALLTANEKEFFERLTQALPGYRVFPQVAMGALIAVSVDEGRSVLKARSRFAQKIVDYVVCDERLNVLGLIELDDRTHVSTKDAARDALTRSAGYWTLRYQSKAKPSMTQIARDVRAAAKRS